jgi:hypothetical protein
MGNKPSNFFNKDEISFWNHPKVFDKIIDQLSTEDEAMKWFKEMTEEWFESDFEEMMRSWFKSGYQKIDHTELKFNG